MSLTSSGVSIADLFREVDGKAVPLVTLTDEEALVINTKASSRRSVFPFALSEARENSLFMQNGLRSLIARGFVALLPSGKVTEPDDGSDEFDGLEIHLLGELALIVQVGANASFVVQADRIYDSVCSSFLAYGIDANGVLVEHVAAAGMHDYVLVPSELFPEYFARFLDPEQIASKCSDPRSELLSDESWADEFRAAAEHSRVQCWVSSNSGPDQESIAASLMGCASDEEVFIVWPGKPANSAQRCSEEDLIGICAQVIASELAG